MGYCQEWVASLKGSVVSCVKLRKILKVMGNSTLRYTREIWLSSPSLNECFHSYRMLMRTLLMEIALYSFILAGNTKNTTQRLKYQYFDIILSLSQQHTEIGLWDSVKWISVYFIFQIAWIIDFSISLLLSFSELCG